MEQDRVWESSHTHQNSQIPNWSTPSPTQTHETLLEEKEAQHQLDLCLKREEYLWRDKAKARWLDEGDANTRFFHLSTIIHRRYNAINIILNSQNIWLTSRQDIGNAFQSYYSGIFHSTNPQFMANFQSLILPSISPYMNRRVVAILSKDEIQNALFSMGNYKSPGPDGFTVIFYMEYWAIVKDAVIQEIQKFFRTASLKLAFNHTFLVLIPSPAMQFGLSSIDQLPFAMSFSKSSPRFWPVDYEWFSVGLSIHANQPLFLIAPSTITS